MEQSPLVPRGQRDAAGYCCHLEVGQPELQKYPLATPRHAGECGAPLSPHNL